MRIWLFFLLICLSRIVPASSICQFGWGQVNCQAGVLDQLKANGLVSMQGTEVRGLTEIHGTLNAIKVKLHQCNFAGSGYLMDSEFFGDVVWQGRMEAEQCRFHNVVKLNTKFSKFSNTQLSTLVVYNNKREASIIHLAQGSHIGRIIFQTPGGQIWLDDNTTSVGHVQGGTIVRR